VPVHRGTGFAFCTLYRHFYLSPLYPQITPPEGGGVKNSVFSWEEAVEFRAYYLICTTNCCIVKIAGVINMAETINVTIRLDREIKEQAEMLFTNLGMNMSTAFNIFARQSLRQGKIPFEIFDPFYSEKNQAELKRRISDIEEGINIAPHELIEIEDV
jgi:DNA-damage-inducible protein J